MTARFIEEQSSGVTWQHLCVIHLFRSDAHIFLFRLVYVPESAWFSPSVRKKRDPCLVVVTKKSTLLFGTSNPSTFRLWEIERRGSQTKERWWA